MVTLVATGVAALLQGGAKADSVAPAPDSSNSATPVTVSNTTSDVNNTQGQSSDASSVTIQQSSTSTVSGSSPSVSSGDGTPPSSDATPTADANGDNLSLDPGAINPDGSPGLVKTDKPIAGQPDAAGGQAPTGATGGNQDSIIQPTAGQPVWTPSVDNDNAAARPMVMTQTGAPAAITTPTDNGSSPTRQPSDKLPLSDGGFFSAWLKPLLITSSGTGGSRAAAIYSLLSVLRAPVKVIAVLMLLSTFFLLWLRRSGYSHAARSDMAALNFATPKIRVTVGVFAVGNSYFCGVRNKNLINVWQGRR